ncbi:MAG: hypothetical protein JXA33_20055, partial [Anaerolineae bacterium]|nr:hypothetical protein [Anaerolineae bacterium]
VLLEAGQDVVCTFTNNKPDAITLDSLTAVAGAGEVTVAWVTVVEVDTVGFNILRSTVADGGFEQVNPGLVVALGSEMGGASYSFVDDTVEGGTTYYYVLQEVLATGGAVDYLEWPVSATPGVVMNSKGSYTIYMPIVCRQ